VLDAGVVPLSLQAMRAEVTSWTGELLVEPRTIAAGERQLEVVDDPDER